MSPLRSIVGVALAIGSCVFAPASGWAQEAGAGGPRAAETTRASHKRALLVAVNGYHRGRPGDAQELTTIPDVEAIRKVLIETFKFDPKEIKILKTPAETTRQSILNHFRSVLIEPTRPGRGDVVYFHYSGHGTVVEDPTGRKLSGKHNCLVPSDYVSDFELQQTNNPRAKLPFGNLIRDVEIRELLYALKAKQPGNVTLSFDSCFSGTITRGRFPVRGLGFRKVFIPPLRSGAAAARGGEAPAAPGSRSVAESPGGLLDSEDPSRLGYAVISAVNSNLEVPETEDDSGKPMGLLSWALARTLATPPEKMTYRDLAEQITTLQTQRYPDRVPQVEGYLDRTVLGTETVRPQPFITVSNSGGRRILLNAGSLHGMTQGSRFAIYPPGTKAPTGRPLAEAEITDLDATLAVLKLDAQGAGRVALEQLNNARAFETRHQFGNSRLRVDASALADDPRWNAIVKAVEDPGVPAEQRAVQLVRGTRAGGNDGGDWNVRVVLGKDLPTAAAGHLGGKPVGARDLVLLREGGTPFAHLADGPEVAGELQKKLTDEARWRFINTLQNPSFGGKMGVKVELVKANVLEKDLQGLVTKVGVPTELKRSPGGQLELAEGDYIQIRVTNTGEEPAYVAILDLRPDGTIGPVFPFPGLQEKLSNLFAPGQSKVLDAPYVFVLTAPYGPESFKVIATNKPADFSFLLSPEQTRAARGRGDLSPLEQFLLDAAQGTRAGIAGAVPSSYSVDQVPFEVKQTKP